MAFTYTRRGKSGGIIKDAYWFDNKCDYACLGYSCDTM